MLIIFGGLPGVGKSAIARTLAADIGAVWLRIDSIEQAMSPWFGDQDMADAGYRVAYAVARDNLRLGRTVIADSVNPIAVTRAAWLATAAAAGAPSLQIEMICSDASLHRRRVEERGSDIAGLVPPTWGEVETREYHPWTEADLVIDTARLNMKACVAAIREVLAGSQISSGRGEKARWRGPDEG